MKLSTTWISAIAVIVAAVGAASAQLQLLPDSRPQVVFGGGRRTLELLWHNAGSKATNADIGARLLQASSATVVRISDKTWKKVQMLPGQTVVESATIDFPPVKAETRFLIQWVEGTSNVVGRTEVLVYPTNLLHELKLLAGDVPLGVFDPANQLKPLLRSVAADFQDLVEDGTDQFHGKLAIFGPFESRSRMRASLKDDIRALAQRGVAVVWLLSSSEKRSPMKPSFYVVPEGGSVVVVAAPELVAGLTERPEAQLHLLRLAEESLHPTPPTLPETETSN